MSDPEGTMAVAATIAIGGLTKALLEALGILFVVVGGVGATVGAAQIAKNVTTTNATSEFSASSSASAALQAYSAGVQAYNNVDAAIDQVLFKANENGFDPRREKYHIVAESDPRAEAARSVLIGVGIDPRTYPLNLAELPYQPHRRIHTNAYFAANDAIF